MEPEKNSLDDLILKGAVEVYGIDDDGNFIYRLTEKVHEVAPELVDTAMDKFYDDLKTLWILGYIDMDIADINPTITLTEKALNSDEVDKLEDKLATSLSFVIKALRIQ